MLGEGSLYWLVSSLTRLELTNEGNIILFVFSEAVQCNLVKLETSRTVMLPPTVCVFCTNVPLTSEKFQRIGPRVQVAATAYTRRTRWPV